MDNMKYELAKVEQPKEGEPIIPISEAVIEKRGHVVRFTLSEVNANIAQLTRNIKEMKAKKLYEEAKITNIEEHHPFVKEISEMDRLTVYMYHEATAMLKAADAVLKQHEGDLAELMTEVEEIKIQIPAIAVEEAKQHEAQQAKPQDINAADVNVEDTLANDNKEKTTTE